MQNKKLDWLRTQEKTYLEIWCKLLLSVEQRRIDGHMIRIFLITILRFHFAAKGR